MPCHRLCPVLMTSYLHADSNLTGTIPASLGTALPDLQLLSLRHNPGNSRCNCIHRSVWGSALLCNSNLQTYVRPTRIVEQVKCLSRYKPCLYCYITCCTVWHVLPDCCHACFVTFTNKMCLVLCRAVRAFP